MEVMERGETDLIDRAERPKGHSRRCELESSDQRIEIRGNGTGAGTGENGPDQRIEIRWAVVVRQSCDTPAAVPILY